MLRSETRRLLTIADKVVKQRPHRSSETQSWFENLPWCIYEYHDDMDTWESQRPDVTLKDLSSPSPLVPPTASYQSVDGYTRFRTRLHCILPSSPDWSNFISTSWIKSKSIFTGNSPFYRKSPSFMFGLQYLKAYHPAARAALFEIFNKTNFSHTLEGFTERKSPVSDVALFPQLDFNCLSLQRSEMFSFSTFLLPIPETRMICKIWICKPLQAPAFPRRTCGS